MKWSVIMRGYGCVLQPNAKPNTSKTLTTSEQPKKERRRDTALWDPQKLVLGRLCIPLVLG